MYNNKLKAALISLGSESSQMIAEEMSKFFDVDLINLKELSFGFNHNNVDFFLNKYDMESYNAIYIRGSYQYKNFIAALSYFIKEDTYTPISPEAFLVMHNKLLTHIALWKQHIPMPRTYIAPTFSAAKKVLKDIVNYPVMIKFQEGTGGKGVVFLESYAAASSFLDTLDTKKKFIIQEFIDSDGEDIRLIVTGDEIAASMKRKAAKKEVRSNYHSGGNVMPYEPSEETKKIAIKAAKAVGAEICGVDIIETELGPLVIEINASPGIQGITKATGKNVAGLIAEFIYRRTEEHIEKKKEKEVKKIMQEVKNGINELPHNLITNIKVRGSKIVLPDVVAKNAGIKDEEEVVIEMGKGYFKVYKNE